VNYLLVNYEYPPVGAGAATATKAIAHALGCAGHEVHVLTGAYAGEPSHSTEDGVTVHRLPCRRARRDRSNVREMLGFLGAGLVALPGFLRRHQVDGAIIFFSFPCGPIGLFARLLKRIPYVIALRGGDVPGTEPELATVHKLLKPLRRLILRRSSAVVANSNGLRDLSLAADPLPVGVIPNGVDTEFFRPPERSSTTGETKPFRVLFVGRFQSQKNIGLLLDEFAQLRNQSARPVQLHLVGDGPLRAELEEHAGQLNLNSEIVWHGWLGRRELRDVLQSCDCFVNPSLYEGMPNAVLEAMACAKPIVASRVPGNDAVVQHDMTGFLFPLHKPGLLRESVSALIDDPARAEEMGRLGREWVIRDFSWKKVALAYAELFERHETAQSVGASWVGP
jgi:glycosyltransferase involved in cell wall biosynthesis